MVTESVTPVVVSGILPPAKLITLAILAMGGEGGGVLSDWIIDIGEHAGYFAQTTSVPGVAQRTGATIYYLELFPRVLAEMARKQPVLALMPVPGEIDVVVASELMEAGRAIDRGSCNPGSNDTGHIYPPCLFHERTNCDGRRPRPVRYVS